MIYSTTSESIGVTIRSGEVDCRRQVVAEDFHRDYRRPAVVDEPHRVHRAEAGLRLEGHLRLTCVGMSELLFCHSCPCR